MAQYRLNGFVVHAQGVKVCTEAAPEGVPAVPLGERFIALKHVSLWLVLILLFFANRAWRESGSNDATHKVVEVQRLPISGLEDRQARLCQNSHAEPVRFERVGQLLHNGN